MMESQEHDMMNDDDDEEYDEEERLKLEFKIKTFLDKASEMDTMYDTVTVQGDTFTLPRRYKVEGVIGRGTFGVVVRCMDLKSQSQVAIKRIRPFGSADGHSFSKVILREIKIMKHLGFHDNIVHLLDLIPPQNATPPPLTSQTSSSFKEIYIVMEYYRCSLFEVIKSPKLQLNENAIKDIMYNLLRGLKYIHSAGIVHRDIKPSNLLMGDDTIVRYCDFGLAVGSNSVDPMDTLYVVTRWYRAPELLTNYPNSSFPVDVWSLGCIFAELITRRVLFPGKSSPSQLELIFSLLGFPQDVSDLKGHPQYVDYCITHFGKPNFVGVPLKKVFGDQTSDGTLDLLSRMLQVNPHKRITVEEALNHPIFEEFRYFEPSCNQKFLFKVPKDATQEAMKEALYTEIWSYYYNRQ